MPDGSRTSVDVSTLLSDPTECCQEFCGSKGVRSARPLGKNILCQEALNKKTPVSGSLKYSRGEPVDELAPQLGMQTNATVTS